MATQQEIMEQLALLKYNTQITGTIHEAQAQHLRAWPYLFFMESSPGEIKVSVDFNREMVIYKVKTSKGKISKERRKEIVGNLPNLYRWINDLLGEEWGIQVEFRGKNIYEQKGARLYKTLSSSNEAGSNGLSFPYEESGDGAIA